METIDLSLIEDLSQLEEVGKKTSATQAHALLELFGHNEKNKWKLSPILMGMAPALFLEMLITMTPEQVKQLQCDTFTDAIQHQLALIAHQISEEIERLDDAGADIERQIRLLDPLQADKRALSAIQEQIAALATVLQREMMHIDKLLALCWYSRCSELIKCFNHIKDYCQTLLTERAGYPGNKDHCPYGLYEILEERLSSVYEAQEGGGCNKRLEDSDPVIDAMERLSIRYLQDYFALGLLPEVSDIKELDLSAEHAEQQRMEYRQNLFRSAIKNLEARGLKTVKDLRKARIFSRTMLEEYLRY
jgi:hypothetical protein